MMHISDVSLKVGHFTLNNARSNKTMMQFLKTMLEDHDIAFDAADHRIMCFAHVIDLSSGQVTHNADNTIGGDKNDFSQSDSETTFSGPIARGHNIVRLIWGSGMRWDVFDKVIKNGNDRGWFKGGWPLAVIKIKLLQLLWDVHTRWDSIYLMLNRLRKMHPVSLYFC